MRWIPRAVPGQPQRAGGPFFRYLFTNPVQYRRAGLDAREARRVARSSPTVARSRSRGFAPLAAFLEEVGLMGRSRAGCGGAADFCLDEHVLRSRGGRRPARRHAADGRIRLRHPRGRDRRVRSSTRPPISGRWRPAAASYGTASRSPRRIAVGGRLAALPGSRRARGAEPFLPHGTRRQRPTVYVAAVPEVPWRARAVPVSRFATARNARSTTATSPAEVVDWRRMRRKISVGLRPAALTSARRRGLRRSGRGPHRRDDHACPGPADRPPRPDRRPISLAGNGFR